MERLNIGLSIVLPTINEEKNLRYLIPEIVQVLNNEYISEYEIIVVDDGSSDETESLISNLSSKNSKIKFLKRTGNPSLPMSIWDGIELSKQKYVMWLDADGSMTSKGVRSIIQKLIENEDSVIIGSRFVDGGGYKGIEIDNKSIFSAFQKVYKSEDSVLAVLLSRFFNKIIYLFLNCGVKDVTSGFIVGKKSYFEKSIFSVANYGDYFVYLIKDLKVKDINMIEVGYICETRKYGESKSGTSFNILLKRALPYFKAAFKVIK